MGMKIVSNFSFCHCAFVKRSLDREINDNNGTNERKFFAPMTDARVFSRMLNVLRKIQYSNFNNFNRKFQGLFRFSLVFLTLIYNK